jgi:mRNA interferase MazF
MVARRFEVFLISLDPTRDSEIQKPRPCLIISPDEMNEHIRKVIVAPMTTKRRPYPSRVACIFQGKQGQLVLDQIRTVDKSRLVRKLGTISAKGQEKVLNALQEMFAK